MYSGWSCWVLTVKAVTTGTATLKDAVDEA